MLSRRRQYGRGRGRHDRGDDRRLEANIRKNRELKYYVRVSRKNVYSRIAYPVDNTVYKYQTFSGFDRINLRLYNNLGYINAYNSNAGLLGTRIFLKRITIHVHGSAHGIYIPTNDNTKDNQPTFYPPPTTGISSSAGSQVNECVVRIALLRNRIALHTLPGTATAEELGSYDATYMIQPAGLVGLGQTLPSLNNQLYPYYNDILPFDPAKFEVLDDRFIPVTLGFTQNSPPTAFSIKFTHRINDWIDMTVGSDGYALEGSDVGRFYLYYRITPLVRTASNLLAYSGPELSILSTQKFSYYDE